MRLYEALSRSIEGLCNLTDHGDPLDRPLQNYVVFPIERAQFACHAAIKAAKPEDARDIELRAALLYDHALRFDGSDEERRAILAGAMLAIPSKLKHERYRFRKSKFGEGGELHEVKDGNRVVWRQWTPAKDLPKRRAAAKSKRKAAKA